MDEVRKEAAARIGLEIARVRDYAEMTQERLAKTVGVSPSHISNIEQGKRVPKAKLIESVDKALGMSGRLERLWRELQGGGRPAWLDAVSDLLRDAASVLDCQPLFVPGLLQTTEYAHRVIETTSPWMSAGEIDTALQVRMERAKHFQESGPDLWVVLDEGVITRRVGSPAVMTGQFEHVLNLVTSRRITLQVARDEHPGLLGAFKIISTRLGPDVVYVESAHSGELIEHPDAIRRYRFAFGALQAVALPPRQSQELIARELERWSD